MVPLVFSRHVSTEVGSSDRSGPSVYHLTMPVNKQLSKMDSTDFDNAIRVIAQPDFGAFTVNGSAEMTHLTHFIFLKI